MKFRILLKLVAISLAWPITMQAQVLSLDVEAVRVPGVGAGWTTVDLMNTYSSPVVACTYNLPSSAANEATVRMRNAGSGSFEIRIQQFETSSAVTAGDVHCLVVDEGAHTLSDGREIEAHTVVSDFASGLAVGWGAARLEDVTATLGHTYSTMVVVGQVMTFNDTRATVFWTNNCSNRNREPTPASFCVGKHIGQINATRNNETLGYIVMEAGAGTANELLMPLAVGPTQ